MSAFVKGKVVFVGDTSVGKTSIIYKYTKIDQEIQATVAASSIPCTVDLDDVKVQLMLWDTAGQEDYHCLVPMYARSAQVGVIVFDQNSAISFENINKWYNYLDQSSKIPHIFLVANKLDLDPEVDIDNAQAFAEEKNMSFFHTSALTGQNVDILFNAIANAVNSQSDVKPPSTVVFTNPEIPQQQNPYCSC